jgi:hypothetical protein
LDEALEKIARLEQLPESCQGVVWLETWEICLMWSTCVAAWTPGRRNRPPGSSRKLPDNNHRPNHRHAELKRCNRAATKHHCIFIPAWPGNFTIPNRQLTRRWRT